MSSIAEKRGPLAGALRWVERLDSWDALPLSPAKAVWTAVIAMLGFHLAIWAWWVHGGGSWQTLLSRWDSGWYRSIVEHGYTAQSAAFYPLYPFVTGALARLTGLPVVLAGTLLSVACLFVFTALIVSRLRPQDSRPDGAGVLLPATPMAWFVFVFSPASYVLHTCHTEALFLAISFLALWAGAAKRFVPAAVLGGLAALTRNQGVLVAAAAAFLLVRGESRWPRGVARFTACGLVSACIYAAYPAHLWWKLGDPFAFLAAQSNWTHAHSAGEFFRGLLLLNPWQGLSAGNVLHHAFVIVMAVFAVVLARRSPAVAVYGLGTVLLFPLQAEFASTFRFGTVLFPVLFLAGDFATRLPGWAKALFIAGLVCLNGAVAYAYAAGRWAY